LIEKVLLLKLVVMILVRKMLQSMTALHSWYFNLLVHREVLWSQALLDEGAIIFNERNNYHNNTYISLLLD